METLRNAFLIVLSATAVSAANNIVLNTVLQGGSDDRAGYILVTYIADDGLSSTGTVCGPLDAATSAAVCNSRGWHQVGASGTVAELGLAAPSSNHGIELEQLSCTGISETLHQISYACTYLVASNVSTCSPQQAAAVRCILNDGELAAIVVGCVALVLLLAASLIVVALVCLCVRTAPAKAYKKSGDDEHGKKAAALADISGGRVNSESDSLDEEKAKHVIDTTLDGDGNEDVLKPEIDETYVNSQAFGTVGSDNDVPQTNGKN